MNMITVSFTIVDDLYPVVKQIHDCYTKIRELKVYDTMIKLWPEKLELILVIAAPEGASILLVARLGQEKIPDTESKSYL